MKKIIFILTLLVLSCSDVENNNVKEYGKVSLSVGMVKDVNVTVKSDFIEASGSYLIDIKNGAGSSYVKGKYEDITGPFDLPIGDYSIGVESCTPIDALKDRGVQRFFASQDFKVITAQTTAINLLCSMANSRVSLEVEDSFKAVFSKTQFTVYENSNSARKFIFDENVSINDESQWVYFNIDETPSVIIAITTTRNDGVIKTYTKVVPIKAKTWHKVRFSSSALNGQANILVDVKDTIIEVVQDSVIDPYE